MKILTSLLLFAALTLSYSPTALVAQDGDYDIDCGNDGDNHEDNPDCPEETSGEGVNPVQAYKANLKREVADIKVFGEAPISFERNLNSRTTDFNDDYWELGYRQLWQHNWNYEVRQMATKTFEFFDIKIRYPSGNDHNFKAVDPGGAQLAPPSHNGGRLYRWSGSTVGYTLVTPSGMEYDFKRTLSPKFQLTQVRNGLGYRWDCTYDANGRLSRVMNNFGRGIQIDRETGPDGIRRINRVSTSDGRAVVYSYLAWGTSGKYVLSVVTYPGGEQATYAYVTANPTDPLARPLLERAHDPMYGGSGARTKYLYNYDAGASSLITGTVLEERNAVTEQKIVSFPLGGGSHPQILEGDGTELTRKYVNGLASEKADGEGRVTTYTRDANGYGFVTARTEANGAVTNLSRDYAGRILTKTDPLGKTTRFTYNTKGFKLTETDELNRTTTWTRDASSRPTRKDYPDGSYETWGYNGSGQPITHRLRNGASESFVYDGSGNLTSRSNALSQIANYGYHPNGLLASVTDPRGFTTSYTYNSRGQQLTVTHPGGSTTRFAYDSFGNRTSVTNELNRAVTYAYDEYNRLKTETDPLNRETSYQYGNPPGCGSCGYVDVVSRITSPGGSVTEYQYDRSRLRTAQTTGAGASEAATTAFQYDQAKNLVAVTDPRGKIWHFGYDTRHQRTSATDPLNNITSWTYDDAGNKQAETRPDGGVTHFQYDNLDQLTRTTDPRNQVTELTYDAAGNVITLKDARSNVYTYGYDALNRQTSLRYPDNSIESYAFDAAGNLFTYTIRAGQTQTFAYDSRNRETGFIWNDGTPAVTKTYDAAGRLLTLNNSASALTYTYDNGNQLLGERQQIAGSSDAKTISYSYDADGSAPP